MTPLIFKIHSDYPHKETARCGLCNAEEKIIQFCRDKGDFLHTFWNLCRDCELAIESYGKHNRAPYAPEDKMPDKREAWRNNGLGQLADHPSFAEVAMLAGPGPLTLRHQDLPRLSNAVVDHPAN